MRQPKLLITGANGFTGEHACRHFALLGFEVIAVTRGKRLTSANIQTEICQLNIKEEVNQLVEKVQPDLLLHLAAKSHVGESWIDPITTIETNVISTLYLIDAIRHTKPSCRIIVVGSSLQQKANSPLHPYGLSKTLQETLVMSWAKLFNLDILVAKPSNIIGPGHSTGVSAIFANKIALMEKHQLEKVLQVSHLEATRDFIDVRDVVHAYEILFARGKTGEIYEISSGSACTLGEMIQIYQNLTTTNFEVQSLDTAPEQISCTAPTTLLSLGWRSTYSMAISLKDTLDYYRSLIKQVHVQDSSKSHEAS